jgi:hypothetical protein
MVDAPIPRVLDCRQRDTDGGVWRNAMNTSASAQTLDNLQALYAAGYQDSFFDHALRKLVERQIAQDEARLQRVEAELAAFEREFNISSEEFWKRYRNGNLADSAEYMEWNVFCRMRERIQARLDILRGQQYERS